MRRLAPILAVFALAVALALPAGAQGLSTSELVQECRPGVEAQEREQAKYAAEEAEGPKWVLPPGCASERVYEETEKQIDESRPPERLVVGARAKPIGIHGAWYGITLEVEEADSWGWIEVHVWGAMRRSYVWHLIPEGRGGGSVHLEWPCFPPHDGPVHYLVTETRGGKSITRHGQIQPRKASYCKRRAEAERHRTESVERETRREEREAAEREHAAFVRKEHEAEENCRKLGGTVVTIHGEAGPVRVCRSPEAYVPL